MFSDIYDDQNLLETDINSVLISLLKYFHCMEKESSSPGLHFLLVIVTKNTIFLLIIKVISLDVFSKERLTELIKKCGKINKI